LKEVDINLKFSLWEAAARIRKECLQFSSVPLDILNSQVAERMH